MNIRTYDAGCVSNKHILSKGFRIFEYYSDSECRIPQYENGVIKIVGGYWTWLITNNNDKELWQGWWNTNEEFDETLKSLGLHIIGEKVKPPSALEEDIEFNNAFSGLSEFIKDPEILQWYKELIREHANNKAGEMAELREIKSKLHNLLAVLNGDGGHFTEKHGIDKSIENAEKRYLELYSKANGENKSNKIFIDGDFNNSYESRVRKQSLK